MQEIENEPDDQYTVLYREIHRRHVPSRSAAAAASDRRLDSLISSSGDNAMEIRRDSDVTETIDL